MQSGKASRNQRESLNPGRISGTVSAPVVVYQAYRESIGRHAIAHGELGGPDFSFERMSWVKPNFLWMMYRSGWGTKPGQEVTLGLRVRRAFFDGLLRDAVASSFDPARHASRAREQPTDHARRTLSHRRRAPRPPDRARCGIARAARPELMGRHRELVGCLGDPDPCRGGPRAIGRDANALWHAAMNPKRKTSNQGIVAAWIGNGRSTPLVASTRVSGTVLPAIRSV